VSNATEPEAPQEQQIPCNNRPHTPINGPRPELKEIKEDT